MENILLIAAVAAGALLIWWVVRKAFKLALLAGIVVVGFLVWYFFIS